MRTRITYIQPPGSHHDKKKISLSKKVLSVRGLKASRQEQTVVGFDEIPDKVCTKTQKEKNSHELN